MEPIKIIYRSCQVSLRSLPELHSATDLISFKFQKERHFILKTSLGKLYSPDSTLKIQMPQFHPLRSLLSELWVPSTDNLEQRKIYWLWLKQSTQALHWILTCRDHSTRPFLSTSRLLLRALFSLKWTTNKWKKRQQLKVFALKVRSSSAFRDHIVVVLTTLSTWKHSKNC